MDDHVICQECGALVSIDATTKVTNEGWMCNECLGKWMNGDDSEGG